MKRTIQVAAAACLGLCAPAAAATSEPVAAPAATAEEADDDPSKFFMFHKPGIDLPTAKADLTYCSGFAGAVDARPKPPAYGGGLIGALVTGVMNGVMEGVERRRMQDAAMRKCMGYLDYDRYFVAEPEWNAMMRGDGAVDRKAAFASGPTPTTERLAR